MAAAVDDLQLKVSSSEYMKRIGLLDGKIAELGGILTEYQTLRNEATNVLGDSDDNLNKLQASLDTNIKAVQGQQNLLKEQRQMLQNQMDNLGLLTQNVQGLFSDGLNAAKSAFGAINAVKDLTD